MLKLDGTRLFNALHEVASFRQILLGHDMSKNMTLAQGGIQDVAQAADWIAETCGFINARTAAREAIFLRDYMRKLLLRLENVKGFGDQRGATIERHDLSGLKSTCDRIDGLVEEALGQQLLVVINPRHVERIDPGDRLSLKAERLFPNAIADIAESGRCLAFERYTASVFHSMRSLESALQNLCVEAGIAPRNPNWHNVLNEVESKINGWNQTIRGANWKEDQHFFSLAISHLRVCKVGWRNYVAHQHATYEEHDAKAVLDGVKAFLNDFAQRP